MYFYPALFDTIMINDFLDITGEKYNRIYVICQNVDLTSVSLPLV